MSLNIILPGLFCTLAMTTFVEFISFCFKKPFHVVKILSRILQRGSQRQSAPRKTIAYWTTALVTHYLIGVFFAYVLDLLITSELIDLTFFMSIISGSLLGLIGILGWKIVFAFHPNPPGLSLKSYLAVIWMGHLIFAVTFYFIYPEFQPVPVEAVIPVC